MLQHGRDVKSCAATCHPPTAPLSLQRLLLIGLCVGELLPGMHSLSLSNQIFCKDDIGERRILKNKKVTGQFMLMFL